ncbi:MAG: hypothetical protein AAB482_01600 [Patescibacteria group bacterium]
MLFKDIFLKRWLDWTLAIIVTVFILLMWAIQTYSIEQDYSFTGGDIFYSIKLHHKTQQQNIESTNFDTSKWKTYRNERLGIEFQYPISWSIRTSESELGEIVLPNIYVESLDGSRIDIFFDGGPTGYGADPEAEYIYTTLDLGGYIAKRTNVMSEQRIHRVYVSVPSKKKFLIIFAKTQQDESSQAVQEVFEKFLLQFKFFEPKP